MNTTNTEATATTIPADAWQYDFHGTLVAIKDLPESSILAMVRRGLSHYAGNELASKLAGFKERASKEANGVAPSDEAVATYKAEASAKMLLALTSGTIGVRSGGGAAPRSVDPVTREARKIARAEIEATLKAKGLKAPKGAETITFADGTYTMEQLIGRRLASEAHGKRITTAAKRAVDSVAKVAGEVGNVDIATNAAEALGL